MKPTILDVLRKAIASQVRVDPASITPESLLSDLGVTSLDLVEIIMTLEEEYEVTIPVDAVDAWNNYKSVGDLIGLAKSFGLDERLRDA
jgi:acyl carrier protein